MTTPNPEPTLEQEIEEILGPEDAQYTDKPHKLLAIFESHLNRAVKCPVHPNGGMVHCCYGYPQANLQSKEDK